MPGTTRKPGFDTLPLSESSVNRVLLSLPGGDRWIGELASDIGVRQRTPARKEWLNLANSGQVGNMQLLRIQKPHLLLQLLGQLLFRVSPPFASHS